MVVFYYKINKVFMDYTILRDCLIKAAKDNGFTMSCDSETGQILRALAASKYEGNFLELGTGVGYSTSWILEAISQNSTVDSVEFDTKLYNIAREHFIEEKRLNLINQNAEDFLRQANRSKQKYDFIFSDTFIGKFIMLDEALELLNTGGIYMVDDLIEQPEWQPKSDIPAHLEKIEQFKKDLKSKKNFYTLELNEGSGLIVSVRR